MKYRIVLLFLCSFQFILSQKTFIGKVVNSETGRPVVYVNIGIVDKAKGTVSEDNGSFKLYLEDSDINEIDSIQFSRIGYKTIKLSTSEFQQKLKENFLIPMEESFYELEEIVVSNKEAKNNRAGYVSSSQKLFGFWNDSLALGGEHASKIRIKKGPLKLEDLSFNMITSISDSLLVRVNVYEVKKGFPGKNISNRNILHTIKKKRGKVIIDLSPYNILVKDHFIVSLELLKIYGGKVGIAISAFDDGARSYTRLLSQDRWRRMRKGTTIAFNLNTSQVEIEDKGPLLTKQRLRKKPEEITILWDKSLSMEQRNLFKEVKFLDAYFKNVGNVNVNFQVFGYSLEPNMKYEIKDGNWEKLKTDVQKIVNDGATRNEVLEQLEIKGLTFLFSDGNGFPENINKEWYGTVFTINSKPKGNHNLLKTIAEDSEANYINLDKIDDMSLAVDYTNRYLADNLAYTQTVDKKLKEIRGMVSDFYKPIPNVMVRVKRTNQKKRTSKDGNFLIEARVGDIIEFTYPGRDSVVYAVTQASANLSITMPIGVKILNEVIVTENLKLKELNKPLNQNVTTNFGVMNAEKTGFAIKQIKGKDLNLASLTIAEALKGKFAGIKVFGEGNDARVKIRVGTRFFAAWDVDGHLYPSNTPPVHIDISNIKNLTIMPGMWSAARYGRIAAGGIIIIRTISQSFDNVDETKNKISNVGGSNTVNFYKGDAVFQMNTIANQPKYIQWISGAKSFQDAYDTYLAQRKFFGNKPHFYADVYKVFLDKWNSQETADMILSNIEEQFSDDIGALKVLAYIFEERKMYSEAFLIYRKIVQAKPSPTQSQRDLAQICVKMGEYKKAWGIYSDYIRGSKEDFADDGIDQIVKDEMLELLEKQGETIGVDTSAYKFDNKKSNIILVIEWNNPNTEFELQFVDPKKNFYTWKHSKESNQNLFTEESLKGYSSKSFEIDNLGNVGEWLVNVKYLGNIENTPSYLKVTIRDTQKGQEIIKVLKLMEKDINYKFLSLSPSKISMSK